MPLVVKLIDFYPGKQYFLLLLGEKKNTPIYFLEHTGVIFEHSMKTATSSIPLWTNIHD